jgi:hypothetical protein
MNQENYKNFILKTLFDNGGSMARWEFIEKFKRKFLQGDGQIYIRPEELEGKQYEDYWENAILRARAELRVDQLLAKGNPVGVWKLTAAGEKAAGALWSDEAALYYEDMPQQIRDAIEKINDPEAKQEFINALKRKN